MSHFPGARLSVVLVGENREDLAGSEWLALRRGLEAGHSPAVDLAHERSLAELLAEAVARGRVRSAHDVAEGGLAVALAERGMGGPERIGARISLADTIRPDVLPFREATGRVIAATAEPEALLALARERGVTAQRIGETGGTELVIRPERGAPWIETSLERPHGLWAGAIPRRLEAA